MTPNTPMTELLVDDLETAVRAFMPLAQVAFLWTHEASPPEGEIQRYRDAYHNVLRALRQSDTRIEGGGERPRHIGMIAHIDHGKTSLTAAVTRIMAEQQSTPAPPVNKSPTPEHVEGDVSVGEVEGGFADWWNEDGRFLDPDTSDVPWFDKREALAQYAYDAALSAAQSSIQRAERERDSATSTLKYCERQWSEERGTMIDKFMHERNRADAAEAQLADAVKAIKEAAKGLDMVHDGLMDPTRPRQAVGEVCAHFLTTTNALLSTIGEKPDAE